MAGKARRTTNVRGIIDIDGHLYALNNERLPLNGVNASPVILSQPPERADCTGNKATAYVQAVGVPVKISGTPEANQVTAREVRVEKATGWLLCEG